MPTKTPAKPKPADIPMPPEWPTEPIEPEAEFETLVEVRAESGGVFPDGTTNHEPIDFDKEPAITAVTVLPPTSNSVIVGLGALAAMSDEEYEQKKAVMAKGLARVKDIQQSLMVDKEDYGRVPGISKPFLQLPGAEKLANFYGYAVRQEHDRLIGQRAVLGLEGVAGVPGEWLSPPLAYHVRSYVHLGSFDGPVIAEGVGEANSWEEKYRYRMARATCPRCGAAELMRGKPDSPNAGKWYCPGFKGGCWSKFELDDPSVTAPGKVENPDPYGLAETLIQIASKRSFVAAIRRATGTSGLFSQDDDSPSVQQQAADSGGTSSSETTVEPESIGIKVEVGAKSKNATQLQHDRLMKVAKEKKVNGPKIADLLLRLFEMEVEPTGAAAGAAVQTLNGKQMGQLIQTIETGELPYDSDEEIGKATIDPDIGAH